MVLIDSPEQTQIIVCCFPTTDTGSSVSYVILYRYGIAYIAINWMYWAVICTWRATKPMSVGGAWLWSLTDICQVNGTGFSQVLYLQPSTAAGLLTSTVSPPIHQCSFAVHSWLLPLNGMLLISAFVLLWTCPCKVTKAKVKPLLSPRPHRTWYFTLTSSIVWHGW